MAQSNGPRIPANPDPGRGDYRVGTGIAPWLSWGIWMLSLGLTAGSLVLLVLIYSRPNVHIFDSWVENTTIAVSCSTVGVVIASRRPENLIGWIFCTIGFASAVRHFGAQYAIYALLAAPSSLPGGEVLAWITSWIWVPYVGLFVLLGLLFPDGELPTNRWRWVAWLNLTVVVAGTVWIALVPGRIDFLGRIRNPLGVASLRFLSVNSVVSLVEVLLFTLGFMASVSLFLRLRRARGVERQQLKWFAYATGVLASGTILTFTIAETVSVSWVWWVGFILIMVGIAALPFAVAIAILKHRLYDIDILINRTLVYGFLTAMLLTLYFGGIVLLQRIFVLLTGEKSTLAVVASTLLIAALFTPLRSRIQSFIDRRFYRSKYDAAKTLEAFSTKLRNDTDLDALSEDLVGVVRETMQPAHVSLWLHSDPALKHKKEKAAILESGRDEE
jgi:hypothetical protein